MSITIFLADDHAVVRDGLKALLQAQPDFKVVGDAANGREAVKQINRLQPNIAILDIAMPSLNGVEATRQLSQECPSVQVIILSMYATVEHVVRALQAGARGYVLKESAGARVVEAVRAVHAGQRYLDYKISDDLIDDHMRRQEAGKTEGLLARLSPREREILQLVVEGKSSAEIAGILSLSPKTVETYRDNIKNKMDISSVNEMIRRAVDTLYQRRA